MGYGFIQKVSKKYNLKNEKIDFQNKKIYPTSKIFIYSFNSKESNKQILINFNLDDLKKIKKKFKILYSERDCFLIEYQ